MPNKCIARINCASSEQCPEWAIQASPTSNGKAVYCQKHYMLLNSSQQVCDVDLGRPATMSGVAMRSANASSYSPRSRYPGSPVSRGAMSPRSSATTNYTKPVSPRFQQDFQNDYEVGGSNEGFNAGSNLRKKNTIRPKSLFTRRNTAPNFRTEEGSVKLLFIIDETDDVNEAIVNLRKFKLIVFAADMNTTNKPDDFEERARVTEDIVDKTAEILSEYMNNPMRIELVLSFLYDYDTRDLDVDFGYFGLRNPKGDILLDTTLDEYITQQYKNGKWYEYPTPDVHEDYDRDTMEQARKEISDLIKTWTDKPGQSEFNKLLKNLRNQLTNTKFIESIARKNYQDAKFLWDQITRTTQQQQQREATNKTAGASAFNTGSGAIASSPASTTNLLFPTANAAAVTQPASNLTFDDIFFNDKVNGGNGIYLKKFQSQEEKDKLKGLSDNDKGKIATALNEYWAATNNKYNDNSTKITDNIKAYLTDSTKTTLGSVITEINAKTASQKKPQQPQQQGQQNRSPSRNNKQRK